MNEGPTWTTLVARASAIHDTALTEGGVWFEDVEGEIE